MRIGTAALLLLFLPAAAPAQQPDVKAVDALVEDALQHWQVPGCAVAIVRGDQVIHLKGYGVRELGKKAPVTPDSLFVIASLTKAFTCAVIALLAEEGKLSWDDPVRKHVPYFRLADPLADEQCTLRDLVCHRTGLARHDLLWYRSPWGLEETVRKAGFVAPAHSFRSKYDYANIPYIVAGFAVARATSGTWQDAVQRKVFDPLGMKGACFSSVAARKSPDFATPHVLEDQKVQTVPWFDDDHQVRASGSIRAGAADMARWLRFQLGDGTFDGKRLISAAKLAETRAPHIAMPVTAFQAKEAETTLSSYGLGWISHDYRGHAVVTHGGSSEGFRSRAVLVPNQKIGIVILANLGETPMPEALRDNLLDLLLGLPKKDWNKLHAAEAARLRAGIKEPARQGGTKPSQDLSAFVGLYQDRAYGDVNIAQLGDQLALKWSSFETPLDHWHHDTFRTGPGSRIGRELVTFALGSDGQVVKLQFQGQEFKKLKE